MRKPTLVIISNRRIILDQVLQPGENRVQLEKLIKLKNNKVQVQRYKQRERTAATKAKDLVNNLNQLPTRRQISCLIKNVLLPLLKPLKKIVTV